MTSKTLILWVALLFAVPLGYAQTKDETQPKNQSLTLIFIGDIMGHDSQIASALNPDDGTYTYDDVFQHLPQIFSKADITFGNLEVTLAGPPYKGYPAFSSPDALVDAIVGSGVDVLVTANNHTVDRGKAGIIRTIDVLSQKGIPFAGAYKDKAQRDSLYPLLVEKNGFRLAILNYTYGTNGIPVPAPTVVNLIDTALIRADYNQAVAMDVDEVIAFMHWGEEYMLAPNMEQIRLARFLQELGIRIVIGSHPHVVQRMEASFDTDSTLGQVAVYSLGNFVSNQRKRYTDGGVMSVLELQKDAQGKTFITNAGYIPTWVHTPIIDGKRKFRILPVSEFEQKENYFTEAEKEQFERFVNDSRALFDAQNYNIPEIMFRDGQWEFPWLNNQYTPQKMETIGVGINQLNIETSATVKP